jgi:hypothetical protein
LGSPYSNSSTADIQVRPEVGCNARNRVAALRFACATGNFVEISNMGCGWCDMSLENQRGDAATRLAGKVWLPEALKTPSR